MQNVISKINSVDIVTVDSDGEIFVPIKPICEAIGIDVESQRDKINSDEILSSTAVLSTAVAADGKEAKSRRRKAEEALGKLRAERLNPQPCLF